MLDYLAKPRNDRAVKSSCSQGRISLIEATTNLYNSVAVSIQPLKAQWMTYYSQRNIDVTHTIYTNQRLNIRTGDYLYYAPIGTSITRYFAVQGYRDALELSEVVDRNRGIHRRSLTRSGGLPGGRLGRSCGKA
jgi:hypothetical protein